MTEAPPQVQAYLDENDKADLIDMYWDKLSATEQAELLKEIEDNDKEIEDNDKDTH